ncbi:uncharacterized protein B0H18DRAFT_1086818 [Fomitopsis serialis]|uniref:uncharacterized protein n=1 Tax=Fomitopsis serialis TaxID=139415 RepID=UPI0020085855|nr:uncharacterized protein B0H18DRAFT_1086818 [Neoantrodia serialis]KAH9918687.1 hypothetical protein B0H18DRAFT_1086818 [Neoantrodia serialis]
MPAPFSSPPHVVPVTLPALYLYPLNDSFVPKHISLVNNLRVKIGRQTNAKTVPAERNGFFDSKVLSRQHAEVWEEGGKIYIKDVKSSNGTFINGERLSPEGLESEPFELKSEDIVEFGIDIVGEDNKTIIHHKVAARVLCVFNDQDAQAAARAEAQQNPPSYGTVAGQAPAGSGFNFAGQQQPSANGVPGQQRRPSMPQGLVGMGGMGGNVRPPGKSGLTFDHILTRLQGELQKSRDTGAELHSLTNAMNEIHDTLGGNLPPNLPPYPSSQAPPEPSQQQMHDTNALNELQSQLRETQMSLATHVEKIRTLEDMLAEQDAIKREVGTMRELMEERRREMEMLRSLSVRNWRHDQSSEEHYMSDDDDARSINTIVPHELERVDEEDEEQLAAEDDVERRRRRDELGRPGTPEPTGMGMVEDEEEQEQRDRQRNAERSRSPSPSPPPVPVIVATPPPPPTAAIPDELMERLNTLSKQLETALEFSRSLEAQHTMAQSTIQMLESKVTSLESLVHETQSQVQTQAETTEQLAEAVKAVEMPPQGPSPSSDDRDRESLTEIVNEWKKSVEGRWTGVQEEWTEERERLRRAREEWEVRMRGLEDGFGNAVSKLESGLSVLSVFQGQQHPQGLPNGNFKHSGGLVTPPSPRSLSAESTRPRTRKKRTSASRGRTRSRSMSTGGGQDQLPGSSASSVSDAGSLPESTGRSSATDMETHHLAEMAGKFGLGKDKIAQGMPFPLTPESSVLLHPLNRSDPSSCTATDSQTDTSTRDPPKEIPLMSERGREQPHFTNLSTAFGVLVLSAAAAAVIWRVKPDGSV